MFEFVEEALDEVALAVERLAEAVLPLAVRFGRDVRHRVLGLDQLADAVRIIPLVGEQDRVRSKPVEQRVGGPAVMDLTGGEAQPDRPALCVDERVDLGREPASRTTQAMISTPLFAVAACWWTRTLEESIIWMSPS